MQPALQFVHAVLVLIAEGSELHMLMAAQNRELEPMNLTRLKPEVAPDWADVSHALRGFYDLASNLILLNERSAVSGCFESG